MIIFKTCLMIVLLPILILNLSQRFYMTTGKEKRIATLVLSACLIVPYFAVMYVETHKIADMNILFISVAVSIVLMVLGRGYLFIFKTKCVSCGKLIGFKSFFYRDDNKCKRCCIEKVADVNWDKYKFKQEAVITFIFKDDEVLLIEKKTGLGAGKINAPGGKVEKGELPIDAAIRECEEEVCLTPKNLEYKGELNFIFRDGYSMKAFVYFSYEFSGEMCETREANPFWCKVADIPYEKMWKDDIYWLPNALDGKPIEGYFIFDDDILIDKRIV